MRWRRFTSHPAQSETSPVICLKTDAHQRDRPIAWRHCRASKPALHTCLSQSRGVGRFSGSFQPDHWVLRHCTGARQAARSSAPDRLYLVEIGSSVFVFHRKWGLQTYVVTAHYLPIIASARRARKSEGSAIERRYQFGVDAATVFAMGVAALRAGRCSPGRLCRCAGSCGLGPSYESSIFLRNKVALTHFSALAIARVTWF